MADPELPDVVGVDETSEMLGVDPAVVSRWYRTTHTLPAPYIPLKCSPLWLRSDIERFREDPTHVFAEQLPEGQRPLLGTAEVALLLAVNKSQVGRWRRAGRFPDPALKIKAGPLWRREDIVNFENRRRAA